jgi:hypothetical protein
VTLGSGQLDAIANVPGKFAYASASGTILKAGNGQTLSVTFTPTDTTDYTTATGTTKITVLQATPSIIWSNPAIIVYGTALGRTELDATANTAGTFAYLLALGTKLKLGNGQTLRVTFTPTDATDYTTATARINVVEAMLPIPSSFRRTSSTALRSGPLSLIRRRIRQGHSPMHRPRVVILKADKKAQRKALSAVVSRGSRSCWWSYNPDNSGM